MDDDASIASSCSTSGRSASAPMPAASDRDREDTLKWTPAQERKLVDTILEAKDHGLWDGQNRVLLKGRWEYVLGVFAKSEEPEVRKLYVSTRFRSRHV